MKNTVIAGALVIIAAAFAGCSVIDLNKIIKDYVEPAFEFDIKPPDDYKPIFVKTVKDMPPDLPPDARVEIKSVDTRTPGMTRLQVHIVDSSGTFYKSASPEQLKNLVCEVVETVNGRERVVTNAVVRELSDVRSEPMALALITDNSGSMGQKRATTVQDAIANFAGTTSDRDALAVVRYDNKVNVEVPLTKNKSQFLSELKRDGLTGYGGGTAILDGTAAGIEHLTMNATDYTDRYAVVFTDGKENASKKYKKPQLIEYSLRSQIPIIAVDFGARINETYMRELADATGGSYYHIYMTEEFELLFADIYRRTRNAYVIEYPTTEYGSHTVRIKVCVGKGSAQDTATYDNSPQVGTVALIDVNFDIAKSTIRDESRPAIQEVIDLMNNYPSMTIELRGHTDSTNSTGDPQYNQKLSQSRAEAVREAIIAAGIKGSRITAKGYGESMPIATNTTPEGRQRNRRTEFVILSR